MYEIYINRVYDLHWRTMLKQTVERRRMCVNEEVMKHRKTLVFSLCSNFVVLGVF